MTDEQERQAAVLVERLRELPDVVEVWWTQNEFFMDDDTLSIWVKKHSPKWDQNIMGVQHISKNLLGESNYLEQVVFKMLEEEFELMEKVGPPKRKKSRVVYDEKEDVFSIIA